MGRDCLMLATCWLPSPTLRVKSRCLRRPSWPRDEAGNGLRQVIFFPKFHCELNHIELYWAAAERYARANCDYSFAALRKTVPEALDSVPLQTIRKNARFCFRYMDAYRRGLSWELAKFATKRYRSHRRVPEGTTIQQIQAEFDVCEQSQA